MSTPATKLLPNSANFCECRCSRQSTGSPIRRHSIGVRLVLTLTPAQFLPNGVWRIG